MEELRVEGGPRPHDRPACAGGERAADRLEIAQTAARLYGDRGDRLHDLGHERGLSRLAGERAVEVDDMEPLGAEILPVHSHRDGVLGEAQLPRVLDAVPTHMRNLPARREPPYHPRDHVEAASLAELLARRKQELVAEADAEKRPAPVQRPPEGREEAEVLEVRHGVVERSVAWEHDGVRLVHGAWILGHDRRDADAAERLLDRPEVAPAVIDNGDHRLASPAAAARTATITDSPRRRLRLALPRSQTRLAGGCGSHCHDHRLASPAAAARTATITGSQRALRRRDDSRDARVHPRGVGERAADGLEHRLRDVVEIVAVVHDHVQGELGVDSKGAEELLQEVEVEVRHATSRHRDAEDEERAPRQVHGRRDERLVHRDETGAVAHDALLVAERQTERLPEHDADVLDRMVLVHLDVALCLDGEVHEAVLRPGLEHVAEKWDRRLDLRGAGAVDVELKRDLGLLGLALHPRVPCRRVRAHSVLPGSLPNRNSAARPCPASPSIRVSALRWGAAASSPRSEYSMTLERLTKSSVPSGDAKRAVPAVGRTWLGPAT